MTAEELFSPAELFQIEGDLARVARELNVMPSSVFADETLIQALQHLIEAGGRGTQWHRRLFDPDRTDWDASGVSFTA